MKLDNFIVISECIGKGTSRMARLHIFQIYFNDHVHVLSNQGLLPVKLNLNIFP